MTGLVYHIVQHDGGWAYEVDGSYSETFTTHDAAHQAADRAAREQRVAGATVGISWEDEKGVWHEELDDGADRPWTSVEG